MDKVDKYCHAARDAVWAVSNGQDPRRELKHLANLEAELRTYIKSLDTPPTYKKAAEQHIENAAHLRGIQPFLLSWAGGGSEEVIGWRNLAKRLRLTEASIRVYFSAGEAKHSFQVKRYNPLIEERDILTVTRLLLPGQAEKPRMGRPPKQIDWERLGTEAPSKR